MNTLSVSKQEKLRALRRSFVGRLPAMVGDVEATCILLLGGAPDPETMTQALRGAHALAGIAGTYGLAEVSAVARSLENLLRPAREGPAALDEEAAFSAVGHLRRLRWAADQAAQPE